MSRRRFLKNLGLASAGLAIKPITTTAQTTAKSLTLKDSPLVISTWIHGMEANAGAWSVLENGGAALDAVQHHDQGDLHEVWIEGEQQMLIDIITPYRIMLLRGTKGNIARWRHSMDHFRPQLATTQEM